MKKVIIYMKTVYIETNGCAVLRHETYKISKAFELNEYIELENPEEADVIIMTGCAVINSTEEYALKSIKRLQNTRKEGSLFVVTGCIPAICKEKIQEISRDIVLLKYNEINILDKLCTFNRSIDTVYYNCNPKRHHSFGDPDIVINDEESLDECFAKKIDTICKSSKTYDQFMYSTRGRHLWREADLFEIRVSYGCANSCSYCATKLAIGDFISVPEEIILKQVISASEQGFKRIMLMGDEVGYWNYKGKDIVDLVSDIEKIDDSIYVGIRYINPDIIVKYYDKFKIYFENGRIYYFCAAFQSGSSRILQLMNRNPNIEPFINCMQEIERNGYPVKKHTQIIVGFPTETAEDIIDTLQCLQKASFDHVTITKYCQRPGTKAYGLELLNDDIIESRIKLFEDWLVLNRNNKLYRTVKSEVLKCFENKIYSN